MDYLLALIGHPVSHSLSPPMHRAALLHCGLIGSYELIDLPGENLQRGVENLILSQFTGFNVTIPHKAAIFALAARA